MERERRTKSKQMKVRERLMYSGMSMWDRKPGGRERKSAGGRLTSWVANGPTECFMWIR